MYLLQPVFLTLCAVIAAVQVLLGLRLLRAFRSGSPPRLEDAECPPVLVVMCLRGTDPFLSRSLRELFRQDYPNYRVRIVLDSESDPAGGLVEEVRRELGAGHVEIISLTSRDRFCSAKMSALLRGTSDLPVQIEFVATFDGDCVLHRSCLRELIAPLVREDATVTTGNRWYVPETLSLAAVARMQWNFACVPLMHAAGLPWGGCLAMPREVIEDAQIRFLYAGAFAEDTLLGSVLQKRGQRVRFVPQAMITNRETIAPRALGNFLTRQMLCLRLHHHRWPVLIGWTCLVAAMGGIVCPAGLLVPGLQAASAVGLLMVLAGSVVPMVLIGPCVRQLVRGRGETPLRMTPHFALMFVVAAPFTQLLTLATSLRSIFARRVTWRGLTYQFATHPRVRLVHEARVDGGGDAFGSPHARPPRGDRPDRETAAQANL